MTFKFFYVLRKRLFLSVCCLIVAWDYSISKEMRTVSTVYNDSPIAYRIFVTKDTFLLHEPVIVKIWAKNMSHSTVNYQRAHLTGWTIKDERGQTYPSHMTVFPGVTKIQPGDSAGGKIGLGHHGISVGAGPPHFPEGDYRLSHWLFGDSVPPLTFTVIKPEGELAKALELYLKSFYEIKPDSFYKLPKQDKDKLYREQIDKLARVADKYPGNIYAIQALSTAVSNAWNYFSDLDLAYRFNSRLLYEYSDPFDDCLALLRSYYDAKKNPDGFRGELEKIINSSADSAVVAKAKRYLEGISNQK